MRILITGATGFVGRTVAKRLMTDGHQLMMLVRNEQKLKMIFPSGKYDFICLSGSQWQNEVKAWDPEVTLHLAAFFTGRRDSGSAEKLIQSNIEFPVQLLVSLAETDCKAVISTGTFTEYMMGDGIISPNNLYSATKSALRPILDYYQGITGWKWINVVVYSPYGRKNENKKVIDYLLDALGSESPVGFSDGYQILDFVHVDDMAEFYSRLISRLDILPNKLQFHLGSGKGHSIREVATVMEDVWGKSVNADWGRLYRNPYDPAFAVAPLQSMLKWLEWTPQISLIEGLEILKDDLGK